MEHVAGTDPGSMARFAAMVPTVRAMVQKSDLEQSLEMFRLALEKYQARPNILYLMGLTLLGLSRFDEAEGVFAGLKEEFPGQPLGYDGLAEVFHRQKRWQECLAACALALEMFPGRPDVQDMLGQAFLGLSLFAEAEKAYAGLKASHPALALGHDGLAKVYHWQQRWAECAEACALALAKFPGRPGIIDMRGQALLALSRFDEAAQLYAGLKISHPKLAAAHEGLAKVFHRQQRWKESLSVCAQALAKFPGNPGLLGMQGQALLGLGRLDEATQVYAALRDLHPQLILGHDGLAEALHRQQRWEECLAACSQGLEKFPDRPGILNLKGHALLGLSRFAEAEELYAGLRAGHPNLPYGYDGLTRVFHHQQRWEECLEASTLALEKFPGRPFIQNLQGVALLALSRFDAAERVYQGLRDAHPQLALGYDGLAKVFHRQQRWEECVEASALALSQFPDRTNMQNLLGQAFMALSRCDEAAELYAGLITTHPELALGYDGLAEVLLRQQRWEPSLEAFTLALEKFPGRPDVMHLRGLALMGLARFDEAVRLYEELRQANPELPFGYDGLAQAHHRLQNWEQSLEACQQAQERFPGRPGILNLYGLALLQLYRFAELRSWLEAHFARQGIPHLPVISRKFFVQNPQITPCLLDLYGKACLACRDAGTALAAGQGMYHYAQEGTLYDCLYGEYAGFIPPVDNSVLGVAL